MNTTSEKNGGESRRSFIKKSAFGAAGLAIASGTSAYADVVGANDTIRVAVAGLKRRGRPLIEALSHMKNVKVTYVCEVDSKQMEKGLAHCEEKLGYRPNTEVDLRKIVEQSDVDAVFLAIPDHWHAYGTMIALQNSKHVYVEKPCSYNLEEDDILTQAAAKYKHLQIQMGSQQRSAPETIEVVKEIHQGLIGEVYKAVTFYSNSRGRVPVPKVMDPPSFLDWEIWQGPAPRRPFLDILEDYNWHWRWHWGTAESANNGTHEMDVARWALQVKYPEMVQAESGKFHFVDDGWEMYDTMQVTFRFPGNKSIVWDGSSRNGYTTYGSGRGTIIYGTDGSVFVNRDGYKVFDRSGKETQIRTGEKESGIALGGGGGMTDRHVKNFLDAIRGEAELNAPITEGAISTHMTHYANISSRTGDTRLEIDDETGHFKDWKVMEAFWGREYAPGWQVTI